MAMTLVEAAKMETGDIIRSSIIELFAQSSDILMSIPFLDIAGNAYKYNQEDTLPGVGFRGVNEAFAESVGVINPNTEALVIGGGDLDVDMFILKTQGEGVRSTHEAMKVKALAQKWGEVFIKGDSQANSKEFDGLQKRLVLTGKQVIANGATSGGDPLSLENLDELIDAVDGATHLYMSKAIRRKLTSASRNTSVGGFVNYEKDSFGRTQTTYNDIPLLMSDENGNANPTLGFDEVAPGGGSAVTASIYALVLQESMLTGIQNGGMDVRDLGELETKPVKRTRVEWYVSVLLEHARASARLRGISNAAVVK